MPGRTHQSLAFRFGLHLFYLTVDMEIYPALISPVCFTLVLMWVQASQFKPCLNENGNSQIIDATNLILGTYGIF